MSTHLKSLAGTLCFAMTLIVGSHATGQTLFSAPESLTDTALPYRLGAANAQAMDFDSSGTLHAVYWAGVDSGTDTSNPSYIYHRSRSAEGVWSSATMIDNSEVTGDHIGGRNPALAVTRDDVVWIGWNDYRHTTQAGNWINNVEIYADYMEPGGSFQSSDLRLTTSGPSASLYGNGYTPQLATLPDGRLSVVWYDFEMNNLPSDIYAKDSLTSTSFDLGEAVADLRYTRGEDRAMDASFNYPTMAVDSGGQRHVVWTEKFEASSPIYYAVFPAAPAAVTGSVIASDAMGGTYKTAPCLALAGNDTLWLAYSQYVSSTNQNVVLMRKTAGAGSFEAPIAITSANAIQRDAVAHVDSEGRVHLVWEDRRQGTHIYYGIYDPVSNSLIEETAITTVSGSWRKPSLRLAPETEWPVILYAQNHSLTSGQIWYTEGYIPNAIPGTNWELYR